MEIGEQLERWRDGTDIRKVARLLAEAAGEGDSRQAIEKWRRSWYRWESGEDYPEKAENVRAIEKVTGIVVPPRPSETVRIVRIPATELDDLRERLRRVEKRIDRLTRPAGAQER